MLAYFDCFSGISGDMTLGAFIDLGVPLEWLKHNLSQLIPQEFDLSVSSVSRHGISAKHLQVIVKDSAKSRHFSDILSLIQDSPLSEAVKECSINIFDRIAVAESGIHGCPKEKVHFHEVGGIDAVVDIVGTSLCVEYLGIETIIASKVPLGKGFVSCQHGRLPVPAPATIDILKGAPVYGADVSHELVTPTGAAIVVTLAGAFNTIPNMTVEKIGYGAGTNEFEEMPNLLRIMIGQPDQPIMGLQGERLIMVETCIDDMNPEFYGFLMDRLFADGALDVYLIPVFMKKNRPGTMVQVLCSKDRKRRIVQRILSETTSLGIRYYEVGRNILPRESAQFTTSFGMVQIKKTKTPNGEVRWIPEYEACKKIALKKNVPLRIVYDTILKEATTEMSNQKDTEGVKTG